MSLSHPPAPGGSNQYVLFVDSSQSQKIPHTSVSSVRDRNQSIEDVPLGIGECSLGSTVVCVTCFLMGNSPGAASPVSLPSGGPIAKPEPAPVEQFSSAC